MLCLIIRLKHKIHQHRLSSNIFPVVTVYQCSMLKAQQVQTTPETTVTVTENYTKTFLDTGSAKKNA